MNKTVLMVAIIAVVVVVIAVVLILRPQTQQFPKVLNVSSLSQPDGVYVYDVYVGRNKVPLVYVQYNKNVLLVLPQNASVAYVLFSQSRFSELYKSSNTTFFAMSYPVLLGSCMNFSITEIIAGVPARVANHICSAQQLPTFTNFVEVASTLSQSPQPTTLSLIGTAQTPFGQAAVYKNSTTITYLFYNINFNYTIYMLNNGVIYKFSILIPLQQYAYNVTYVLRSVAQVNSTYTSLISNLSGVLPISDMGGLSLVEAAKKLGMEISAGQPTVLAYLGLNDTSSARLLLYNYTLFRGAGLIILDPPNQPLIYAERLRCLYANTTNKTQVIDVLQEIYRGLLDNISDPYVALPNNTCPVDISSESALLSLALAGLNMQAQTASSPVVIVVYPNGTYTAITGYNPSALKAALGR